MCWWLVRDGLLAIWWFDLIFYSVGMLPSSVTNYSLSLSRGIGNGEFNYRRDDRIPYSFKVILIIIYCHPPTTTRRQPREPECIRKLAALEFIRCPHGVPVNSGTKSEDIFHGSRSNSTGKLLRPRSACNYCMDGWPTGDMH